MSRIFRIQHENLSRNTKVLDSFSSQKLVVNACSMLSGYSVFRFTDIQPCQHDKQEWHLHHMRQKNYRLHTITRVRNVICANCCTCTSFFLKQTALLRIVDFFCSVIQIVLKNSWIAKSGPCAHPTQNSQVALFSIYATYHVWKFRWLVYIFPN